MVVAAVGGGWTFAARPDRTPQNGFASGAYPPNPLPRKNTRVPQKVSAAWGEATLYRDRHSNRGEGNGG